MADICNRFEKRNVSSIYITAGIRNLNYCQIIIDKYILFTIKVARWFKLNDG